MKNKTLGQDLQARLNGENTEKIGLGHFLENQIQKNIILKLLIAFDKKDYLLISQ